MRTIKCQHCGAIVQASGTVSLCPDCQTELKTKSTLAPRTCRTCGAAFWGGPRAWYCPDCRSERTKQADKEYKARTAAGKTRKIGSTDICAVCNKPYIVTGGNQRYCPDCAPEAVRNNDREQGRQWMAAHRAEQLRQKKDRANTRRVCKVCGTQYYDVKPRTTCSPECAKVLKAYNQAMADHRRRGSPAPTMDAVAQRLARQSGIVGVTAKPNGKWQAVYKKHYIGVFDAVQDAAEAIRKYKETNNNDG